VPRRQVAVAGSPPPPAPVRWLAAGLSRETGEEIVFSNAASSGGPVHDVSKTGGALSSAQKQAQDPVGREVSP